MISYKQQLQPILNIQENHLMLKEEQERKQKEIGK